MNIAASAVLIGGVAFVPAFGVEGAAVANVVARVAGLAVACRLVLRHTDVRMRLAYLRPFPWKTLRRMLGVGIPSSGEQMNYDLAQIVILVYCFRHFSRSGRALYLPFQIWDKGRVEGGGRRTTSWDLALDDRIAPPTRSVTWIRQDGRSGLDI